jgi:hypothetical protein
LAPLSPLRDEVCFINILWRYLSAWKNFINPEILKNYMDFFAHLGWFTKERKLSIHGNGLFFAKSALMV